MLIRALLRSGDEANTRNGNPSRAAILAIVDSIDRSDLSMMYLTIGVYRPD